MELEVNDMTCGHCAGVITKAVKAIDAQAQLDIDLAKHTVRIESTHRTADFVAAIEDAGYTPVVRS